MVPPALSLTSSTCPRRLPPVLRSMTSKTRSAPASAASRKLLCWVNWLMGHGGLADKYQIAGQAAHVGHPLQGHDAAQNRDDGIIDIGDADHGGNHGGA